MLQLYGLSFIYLDNGSWLFYLMIVILILLSLDDPKV